MLTPWAASSGRSSAMRRRLARVSMAARSSRIRDIVRLDRRYAYVDDPRMQTNRSETRSISIAAPPEAVLDFLADARALPRWAPNFARAVRPDGDHWLVDDGEAQFAIDLRVSREAGTVDIVRPGDRRRGF